MADINGRSGQNRIILAIVLVSLTLVALAGIKFMMSDSSSESRSIAEEPQDIFNTSGDAAPPPALSPLSRSENPGAGSLDMFSKTNAGYYGEEESTAPAAAQSSPVPAAKVSAKPSSKKTAATAKPKAKTDTTVIPRMKTTPFKSITPTNVTPGSGKQALPDMSEMMRQAKEQAAKSGAGQ